MVTKMSSKKASAPADRRPRATRPLPAPRPAGERRRPGPRVKNPEYKRGERLPVLLKPREKDYLFDLADDLGMAAAEYIRFAAFELARMHRDGEVDLHNKVEEYRGLQGSNLWPSAPEADG